MVVVVVVGEDSTGSYGMDSNSTGMHARTVIGNFGGIKCIADK